jgi:hypothetical protein
MKSPRTNVFSVALSLCSLVALHAATVAHAEDLKPIFDKVQQYYQEKNYAKALEELSWAQKEIEKANTQATVGFFPDEVDGFKGGKVENANVFGITNIERTYSKSEDSIKVSLLGSSKGQQNPLGGLAAMGQMAAMMGGQPGMDSFRMDGRTAMLEQQDDSVTLTIFLDGSSMMKFEMSGSNNGENLKKFASNFKIADIEKHLKG